MSNEIKKTNGWERVSKLWFMIGKMLLDEVRNSEKVADMLQVVVDALQAIVNEVKVYLKPLFAGEVITFNGATIIIYKLIQNATFLEMLGSLGEQRRRWKNKEEALAFAKENKDKLGPNANFFEMEDGSVADVRVSVDGEPYVDRVCKLSYDHTWYAKYGHCVFVPQL